MEKSNLKYLLLNLWKHIKPNKRIKLISIFILMLIASLSEILTLGAIIPFLGVLTNPNKVFNYTLLKPIILYFNFKNANEMVLPITIIFIFTVIFSGFIRLILMWAQTKISFQIGTDLGYDIYEKTLNQNYEVHISRNSSLVISGIWNKVNNIISAVIMPILTISSSLFIFIFYIVALLIINPLVAVTSFSGFALTYYLILSFNKKKILKDSQIINFQTTNVLKSLNEGLGGIRDVIIDGSQQTFLDIYKKSDSPLKDAQSRVIFMSSSPRYAVEAVGMIIISLLSYNLTTRNSNNSEIISILGAMALGAQRLLPLLQQSYGSYTGILGSKVILKDTLDLLNQPSSLSSSSQIDQIINFDNQICISNLSFQYGKDLPFILQDINLIINKGDRIGIIGTTGNGKSTLVDLIMQLLYPTTGSILVDNKLIEPQLTRAWQNKIAHLPQSIFLIDATISENIAFGVPKDEIDIHKVAICARKAMIYNTISCFPDKFETLVGERGVRISGGQRQRIGIARALYKNAELIILDEATSALDEITENEVINAIEDLDNSLTFIIVAHRLSTLKNCNKIYSLNNKSIKLHTHLV